MSKNKERYSPRNKKLLAGALAGATIIGAIGLRAESTASDDTLTHRPSPIESPSGSPMSPSLPESSVQRILHGVEGPAKPIADIESYSGQLPSRAISENDAVLIPALAIVKGQTTNNHEDGSDNGSTKQAEGT